MMAPIMVKGKVIVVLRLYTGVSREFTEDEIMLVTALAHQETFKKMLDLH